VTDSGEALSFIAAELGDLRRRYRRDGQHWPPVLESLRLLASSGQGRPIFDGDILAMNYESAGRLLGVSERTVRRLVANGELPRVEIGGCSRVTVDDLRAYKDGLMRERTAEDDETL
jgi:excisionase family DNA binding protein